MKRHQLARLATLLTTLGIATWACVEEPTAPARCPDFCPSGRLDPVESLLATAISNDSSFQGYVGAHQATVLLGSAVPGIDSRPIYLMSAIGTTQPIDSSPGDTITGPVVVDSMKMTLTVMQRGPGSQNLRLSFYKVPVAIDTTTTFAALDPSFSGAPLRVLNLDSLLALPGKHDLVTGDSVLSVDSIHSLVTVRLKFDSAVTGYDPADSGKLAFGVRVSADSAPAVKLGSARGGRGPLLSWFYRVDSAGKLIRPDSLKRRLPDSVTSSVLFDSFVYNAPVVTFDSNLFIGGVPSTRALLRINLPRGIRDSTQIIRAQLLLVPTATPPIVTGDSVLVVVDRLATDVGSKSPLVVDTAEGRTAPFPGAPTDTVRIELTTLFRLWQTDTLAPTSVFLRLLALNRSVDSSGNTSTEGGTFSTLQFNSSRTPALRPSILLTFVPRFKFAMP